MKLFTLEEFENQVRKETDCQDSSNFVGTDEFVEMLNEGIDVAEGEIMKVNEDYFLNSSSISLISGTSDYDLPSDIFGQKIRSLIYANGTKIYPIKRIKDPEMFYKKKEIDTYGTSESEYCYILKAATAGAQCKIVLSPTPQETGAFVTAWYLRNAHRIPIVGETVNAVVTTRSIQLAKVIDLPECAFFLKQFMKVKIFEKEMDPRLPGAIAVLESYKQKMVETLTDRTPDNDNLVPADLDFYFDMN